jgi:hypothetical protein
VGELMRCIIFMELLEHGMERYRKLSQMKLIEEGGEKETVGWLSIFMCFRLEPSHMWFENFKSLVLLKSIDFASQQLYRFSNLC